jgi:hypothetical protein
VSRAASRRRYYERLAAQVYGHYGQSCVCPGCTTGGTLSLDHKFGNGPEHRERLGISGGIQFYLYLLNNRWPAECEPGGKYELQAMCLPCNTSKKSGDHCRVHCTDPEHEHRHDKYRQRQPRKYTKAEREAEMVPVILEIRSLYASTRHLAGRNPGKWTAKKLAGHFGLTQRHVTGIIRRERWPGIEPSTPTHAQEFRVPDVNACGESDAGPSVAQPAVSSRRQRQATTPEARANIAAGALRRYESAEARAKTGAVNKGRKRSQETRDKIAAASQRRWALPEERERARAAAQRREAGEPALIRSRGETARQARVSREA